MSCYGCLRDIGHEAECPNEGVYAKRAGRVFYGADIGSADGSAVAVFRNGVGAGRADQWATGQIRLHRSNAASTAALYPEGVWSETRPQPAEPITFRPFVFRYDLQSQPPVADGPCQCLICRRFLERGL